MIKEKLVKEIAIPEGVSCTFGNSLITIESNGTKLEKKFHFGNLVPSIKGNNISVTFDRATKRERTLFGTFQAISRNMFSGVKEPFKYKLKICSGHFPMNVSLSGQDFQVKNFLGESIPRKLSLPKDVKVKVEGEFVLVESPDKERAGMVAAKIEKLTRVPNRDSRIFQDGIYIVQKHNKKL